MYGPGPYGGYPPTAGYGGAYGGMTMNPMMGGGYGPGYQDGCLRACTACLCLNALCCCCLWWSHLSYIRFILWSLLTIFVKH